MNLILHLNENQSLADFVLLPMNFIEESAFSCGLSQPLL